MLYPWQPVPQSISSKPGNCENSIFHNWYSNSYATQDTDEKVWNSNYRNSDSKPEIELIEKNEIP